MATTAQLTRRLNEIEAAIATGATSVAYTMPDGGSHTTMYRSLGDMERIRDGLKRQLGLITTERQRFGRMRWGAS